MRLLFRRIADYIRECDKLLYILILVTTSFGCIAVLSTTYAQNGPKDFITQAVSMLLGIIAIIVISSLHYKNICRFWPIVAAVGLIPVLLTFFIGFAPGVTDDKAWLMLPGNISFQPSELLKICFIMTFAYHCFKIGDKVKKFWHVVLLCIHGAAPVVLIHFQGDDGTALVFAFMFIGMMFVAGVPIRYFIILLSAAVVAAPFAYFFLMNDDQQARINALFTGEAGDYLGTLYQQYKGRIALANGGFFGQGLFNGTMTQSGGVPYGYNDFIFTCIGEELGLIGCLLVLVLIAAVCIRILRIGFLSDSKMGLVICTGIFMMLLSQTIINVGMCLWLLPVIGVTLPLFSAGGTSLLFTCCGFGLVMSVYMHRNSGTVYLRDEMTRYG